MRYRFKLVGGSVGPEAIEKDFGALGAEWVAVMGQDEGCATVRAWCEHWAEQLGDPPKLVGFETYDVFADDDAEPSFTLVYTGWCDAGWLFYQGTAKDTGWSLWPEGFRPSEREGAVVDRSLDGDGLTEGFQRAMRGG